MSELSWKITLEASIPADLAQEINTYEGQLELKKLGKIDDKVFAETRLRRGAYGQRYDNGQRQNGQTSETILYPSGEQAKGPETLWDAPGMQRIKVPYGGLSAAQLEVLAELAREYADGILHVTTRQDFQLHFVHIDDTPDLMRRLAAVGLTTLEACGNSVRNITGCPLAGVCRTQAFDVTPYAHALTYYLLGHDDVQDFGRKFKIAFSGCAGEACGLAKMHDLGFVAQVKTADRRERHGFTIYVGGGLGTVPQQAKILADFVPVEEILPLTQAVCRVFARHGEKRNRNRARLKFLVTRLGIETFRELVFAELESIPHDERWTAFLDDLPSFDEKPVPANGLPLFTGDPPEGFPGWLANNTYQQRQPDFATVTVQLPLGDLSSSQAIGLADIGRRFAGDHVRTTVEQNIVLRWIRREDLPALYTALQEIGLGEPYAGTIVDITTCPGTDTCKLGIASSRGLTAELRTRLAARNATLPLAIRNLRIKVSGCFNSCGQHHVADIGFFGNSRRRGNRTVPHFQVVLGGQWDENAGSFGLALGAVPSKAIPDVLDLLTSRYAAERLPGESFQAWVGRRGKLPIREMLQPFQEIPAYEEAPVFYSDWGDPREFTIGDIGVGECAGEVISLFSFEITRAEGVHFDALVAIDEGQPAAAEQKAYEAMLLAARALVRTQFLDIGDDPDRIVAEFERRFVDTELFFDRYARGKFARYLLDRHANPPIAVDDEGARQLIGEAQLFIEAAHACDARLSELPRPAAGPPQPASINQEKRQDVRPPSS